MIVPGGVTLPPTDGEDAGTVQTIGARFAHGAAHARGGGRAGLPRLRVARRRLPVPRHGRHRAGGRRSARPRGAAQRAGALGPADLARRGPPLGARVLERMIALGLTTSGRRHRRRHPQRDGRARRLRRIDQPAAAHPRHRARGRAARVRPSTTGSPSTARCRASSTRCRTARIRPCACSSPAACPR